MNRIVDTRKVELDNGLLIENGFKLLAMGDANAHKFSASVYKGGVAESLSNTSVMGYFIRPDGVTVTLSGTASGNIASVELTDDCYKVQGAFTLSIQIRDFADRITVRLIHGTIAVTQSNQLLDNGETIIDLDTIESRLNAKIDEPIEEGLNGYALTTDGNGGRTWANPASASSASNIKVDGVGYSLRTGTSGIAGAITFVLEG